MLTREELEDIMNNQPYGAGKQLMKKGLKKSTFIASPYKKTWLEQVKVTVLSSDKNAYQDAQRQFYSTHAKNIEYDGVEWKRQV
jgi:hypothetical protein